MQSGPVLLFGWYRDSSEQGLRGVQGGHCHSFKYVNDNRTKQYKSFNVNNGFNFNDNGFNRPKDNRYFGRSIVLNPARRAYRIKAKAMQRHQRRQGTAVVEFALVVPLFVILILGILEVGRALMVQQVLINASREGARGALIEEATIDSVKDVVVAFFEIVSVPIDRNAIIVTPDPALAVNGTPITVSVSVAYQDVQWLSRMHHLIGRLEATTTMRY
jgi:hypothetical protein